MTSPTETYKAGVRRSFVGMAVIFLLVILFFILNIAWGSVVIPFREVLTILCGGVSEQATSNSIILQTRLPQAVTALLAGAGLGVAGLLMQTLFRNPLAEPSVLGVSSGASLGVAIMMLFINLPGGKFIILSQVTTNLSVIVAAFAGAFLILVLLGVIAGHIRSATIILIIGIMISYAVGALVGVLQFYSLKEDLQAFVIWGLGSFANVAWKQMGYFSAFIISGIVLSFILVKPLNGLLLGEHYARNLGIDIRTSRVLIIIATGILAAAVTAYCGPIAFLGLAVPHISRNIFRTSDHVVNVPGVILSGALLALICNMVARVPGFDGALPVNAITSIIGAPVVIWIIIKRNEFKSQP